jgi:hypothetical protein
MPQAEAYENTIFCYQALSGEPIEQNSVALWAVVFT